MVFKVHITNIGDHPRTHPVIAWDRDWKLSPASDLPPEIAETIRLRWHNVGPRRRCLSDGLRANQGVRLFMTAVGCLPQSKRARTALEGRWYRWASPGDPLAVTHAMHLWPLSTRLRGSWLIVIARRGIGRPRRLVDKSEPSLSQPKNMALCPVARALMFPYRRRKRHTQRRENLCYFSVPKLATSLKLNLSHLL